MAESQDGLPGGCWGPRPFGVPQRRVGVLLQQPHCCPPSLLALPLGSTKTPRLLSQNTQILQNTAEGWGQGCTEGRMGLEPDLCRWQGRGGGCRDVILPVLCCRNRLGLGQGEGFG